MVEYAGTAHSPEAPNKSHVADPPIRSADAVWAYAILRLSFGANIMLHGVARLVAGNAAFLAYLTHYFEKTPEVPATLLPLFARTLPFAEAGIGLLLVLGLWTRFALIAGALVMTGLVIGSNLAQDWTIAGLQLIYVFIYYYLLAHRDKNTFSLDGVLNR